MRTCPNGHWSADAYWCEVCGNPTTAALSTSAEPAFGYGFPTAGEPTAPAEWCPSCWTPCEVAAPFCGACGYTFPTEGRAEPLGHEAGRLLPPTGPEQHPYAQQHLRPEYQQEYQQPLQHQQPYASDSQVPSYGGGAWSATVGPDRSYFTAMMRQSGPEAAGLQLPADVPERHLVLSGGQITIGRRRVSYGESPDIDLSAPLEDPGVSHQHAMLVRRPDGTWAVMDQNSTNGTTINGAEEPIQPYVPVPLRDGDHVHIGAWTRITVRFGRTP